MLKKNSSEFVKIFFTFLYVFSRFLFYNNRFMRRGIVGSFKDELTPELQTKIDKWSADYLAQHGFKEEDIFGKI